MPTACSKHVAMRRQKACLTGVSERGIRRKPAGFANGMKMTSCVLMLSSYIMISE